MYLNEINSNKNASKVERRIAPTHIERILFELSERLKFFDLEMKYDHWLSNGKINDKNGWERSLRN